MSKSKYYRYKRKISDGSDTLAATAKKHVKKNVSKGQTTISKFFLSDKECSSSTMQRLCDPKKITGSNSNNDNKHTFTEERTITTPVKTNNFARLGENTLAKLKQFMKSPAVPTEVADTFVDVPEKFHNVTSSFAAVVQENLVASSAACKEKLTPFEQQIMDLKTKYPGMLLFVETGYKYKLFGDDAKVAADELNIMVTQDHNFLSCSIPTHRLNVHVRRLVHKGHKVGVVKQTETSALKATSATKSSIFSRQLAAVYTKSTLIGEDVESALDSNDVCSLACIVEAPRPATNLCDMAIVVVEPSTGEALFDSFVDGLSRAELEKRLVHLRPTEVIIAQSMSATTLRLLNTFSCRIERVTDDYFALTGATMETLLSSPCTIAETSEFVLAALSALSKYLHDFGLSRALTPLGLKKFTEARTTLQIDASSVRNLHLFDSDNKKATLFCTLDQTRTSFGSRLLRRWISQPLCCLEPLLERQQAVTQLLNPACSQLVHETRTVLEKLPDLERDLTCCLHAKCNTAAFANLLECLGKLHHALQSLDLQVLNNTYVASLFHHSVENLQPIHAFIEMLDLEAARRGDKTKLLQDWSMYPQVTEHRAAIDTLTKDLVGLRASIARSVSMMSVDYTTVCGMEYVIELKHCVKVPASWTKVGSTKVLNRWRPPAVAELLTQLQREREKLATACSVAWLSVLASFSDNYHVYKAAVVNLATLDALIALAQVSKQDGFCRPELLEGEACIEIKNGRHPILAQLSSPSHQQVVANHTMLGGLNEKCMIITGPNMGGKSCYMRQVALLVLMTQIGCYIPAEKATINLVDAIFTRMGSRDVLHQGRSTLLVELEEASVILKQGSPRSLAIIDELGRGTSSCDGAAIALASLAYLARKVSCLTLFVTHYPVVMTLEQQFPQLVKNYHMAFRLHDCPGAAVLTFLYELERGGAHQSYGLNVARLARLPASIISVAAMKAQQLEQRVVTSSQKCKILQQVWRCSNVQDLRNALASSTC